MTQQPAQVPPQFQYQQMPDTTFGTYDFNAFPDQQTFNDTTFSDPNQLSAALNQTHPQTFGATAPSTDLVRRTWNQYPVQQERSGFSHADDAQQEEETEQDLDAKVALAKRDAQGKRKQIPPFVQKLSRYIYTDSHGSVVRR